MLFKELTELRKKKTQVYAFYGPSGTGKSFRAKLVGMQYGIKAIIDDGLLIQDEMILAGHSAKLEKSYMGAVRVALFDDKAHRDEVAKAIHKNRIKKILILGTSQKMVNKIAVRLQLPIPEKYIKISDIATQEQIAEAQRSRNIEGKHVIPVRAYEIKSKNYSGIMVDTIRVSLAKRGILSFLFGNKRAQTNQNSKLFEKSVVRPSFSVQQRKVVSQALIAHMTSSTVLQFNQYIHIKKLSIRTDNMGYMLILTVDLPFGSQLAEITQKLKDSIRTEIEKIAGIFVKDISIIIDKVNTMPQA